MNDLSKHWEKAADDSKTAGEDDIQRHSSIGELSLNAMHFAKKKVFRLEIEVLNRSRTFGKF